MIAIRPIAVILLGMASVAPAGAERWFSNSNLTFAAAGFSHKRSHVSAGVGQAHHSAVDAIAAPGKAAIIEGKFAYGSISKDLEQEAVSLWMQDAGTWKRQATETTDDDGRVRFKVAGERLPGSGSVPFVLQVHGDGTHTEGRIWVLPAGTTAVLFDVDGTLTTGDLELVEFIAVGNAVNMRPDADALARHWAERGVLAVYITGRPYLYHQDTKRWLEKHGFPAGPLITTRQLSDGLPGEKRVGRFKLRWLHRLTRELGTVFVAAYGNSSTDVCAYARAGISPHGTFIVGDNGGASCPSFPPTRSVQDYGSHLRALEGIRR